MKYTREQVEMENTAVHCDTEEKAERLFKILREAGAEWSTGKDMNIIRWSTHKNDTCYNISNIWNLTYGGKISYENIKRNIITFDEYIDILEGRQPKKKKKKKKPVMTDKETLITKHRKGREAVIKHTIERGYVTIDLVNNTIDGRNVTDLHAEMLRLRKLERTFKSVKKKYGGEG